MSKDYNLILQMDVMRRGTQRRKKKLNEWEDRVIVNKMETAIFDGRRDGKITK